MMAAAELANFDITSKNHLDDWSTAKKVAKPWINVYRDKLRAAKRQGQLVGVLLILIPNHSGSNQDEKKCQIVKIPFFLKSQQNKKILQRV